MCLVLHVCSKCLLRTCLCVYALASKGCYSPPNIMRYYTYNVCGETGTRHTLPQFKPYETVWSKWWLLRKLFYLHIKIHAHTQNSFLLGSVLHPHESFYLLRIRFLFTVNHFELIADAHHLWYRDNAMCRCTLLLVIDMFLFRMRQSIWLAEFHSILRGQLG